MSKASDFPFLRDFNFAVEYIKYTNYLLLMHFHCIYISNFSYINIHVFYDTLTMCKNEYLICFAKYICISVRE